MSRSLWKGFFQSKHLLKISLQKNYYKIWSRDSIISSKHLNKVIHVHLGNKFKKVYPSKGHLGYKFGEFGMTRAIKKLKK